MTDNRKLASLKARETEIQQQLIDVRKEIYEENLRLVKEKYGVAIGSVVMCKGVEYRVVIAECFWAKKPWVSGNRKRKDGTFGTGVQNLYGEWELAGEQP